MTTSLGAVFLPEEAATGSEALRLADHRLYAHKHATEFRPQPPARGRFSRRSRNASRACSTTVVRSPSYPSTSGGDCGLPPNELDLRIAAELHDVGKLAIPDAILEKPGPLSRRVGVRPAHARRRAHRRRVSRLGRRRLIIRASHERWDGTGYVDRLKGTEIPLAARIIFVCDAFEAMTAERPYRARLTVDQAVAVLRRNAGKQFDPEIVAALCATTSVAETPDLQPATSNGDSKPVGSTSGSNLARQPA